MFDHFMRETEEKQAQIEPYQAREVLLTVMMPTRTQKSDKTAKGLGVNSLLSRKSHKCKYLEAIKALKK